MINDTQMDSGERLHWECKATGRPRPTYRWLRNGLPLTSQVQTLLHSRMPLIAPRSCENYIITSSLYSRLGSVFSSQGRIEIMNGELTIHKLQQMDSGMYQCVAENKYGNIYSNAELKILGNFMTYAV